MKMTAHEVLEVRRSVLANITSDTTTNGTAVDTQNATEILVFLDVGVIAGTTPTVDVVIEHSDTSGGTYAAITGATFTQITTSNDDNTYEGRIEAHGVKRWIRAAATSAGTMTSGVVSCGFALLAGRDQPVAHKNTVVFNVRQ